MSIPSACLPSEARAGSRRPIRLGLGLLLAALALGCRGRSVPNVLLVTLDTTRADHLGCYGYPKPTTPAIDALAAEGYRFTRAFATNPITLPSHSSILTGTYPLFHGVRDNGTYVLRDDVTTLPEVLSARGYDTAAFVGSFVLDSRFNLDQGFGLYDDKIGAGWSRDELAARTANAFGFDERKANVVTAAASAWLRQPRPRPWFAWVHYFDPHQPLNPPEPHRNRFVEGYDGEIAFVDEQLGKLLDVLKQRGAYENTLIVVMADHGEGLLDHDEPTHSLLIFDSTMHVPLILKLPREKGGKSLDALASGVDVMPTVLSILGIPVPAEVQGQSLLPVLRGAAADPRRAIYMESLVPRTASWGELRALRTAGEKLIWGPKPRLYRVAEDPAELRDLASREPETVARMRTELERALKAWGRPASQGSVAVPESETLQRLAALGYVAGSAAATRGVTDRLEDVEGKVDPHEKTRLFHLWVASLDDLRMGLYLEAIRKLDVVLAGDPGNSAALSTLATTYLLHAHQPRKARELYEQSLALDPYQEEAHLSMAAILRAQRDYPAALEHCRAILAFEPRSVRALAESARILRIMGRLEEAQKHYELALEVAPSEVGVLLALGAFHGRAGRHQEAWKYLKRAQDVDPTSAAVMYDVAIWYLQDGNTEEALATLNRAIAADARDPDAHYVLGKLLFESGDKDRARLVLRRARDLAAGADRIAAIDEMLRILSP